MSIEEIRKRHGVESAMDVNDQYSEWSHPALAARLRQSNRDRAELLRKYEALVEGINSAQSHTAEALRLLQWDQLGWDVPEEVIESLGNADSELRALLEESNDE